MANKVKGLRYGRVERLRRAKGRIDQGISEKGPVIAGRAAKACLIPIRRSYDDAAVIYEIWQQFAGKAGGEHHQPPRKARHRPG